MLRRRMHKLSKLGLIPNFTKADSRKTLPKEPSDPSDPSRSKGEAPSPSSQGTPPSTRSKGATPSPRSQGTQSSTYPSKEDIKNFLDFLENLVEDDELNRQKSPKVGRNEPCPCGSGKKYKRCCAD